MMSSNLFLLHSPTALAHPWIPEPTLMVGDLGISEHVVLAALTTWQVGGPARYFAEPQNQAQLRELLFWARRRSLEVMVLGKGSNLVISDQGFDGLVIYLGRSLAGLRVIEDTAVRLVVEADGGLALWDLVDWTVERGWSGMENMIGIPGTIGGGVFINAGAFDQEIMDTCVAVTSMSMDGVLKERPALQCGFGYRRSRFFGWNEIILTARFEFSKGNPVQLKAQRDEIWRRRQARQPLQYPNGGSMFKRPPGTFAGKLVEEAGLKGFQVGGAAVSVQHSNFLIAMTADCTAQDVWDLSNQIIAKVEAHSGIRLEREQIFIGNFS
jgi:UDP-N-acetylmuramate dehydrogenase